jgi:hypothetical protein
MRKLSILSALVFALVTGATTTVFAMTVQWETAAAEAAHLINRVGSKTEVAAHQGDVRLTPGNWLSCLSVSVPAQIVPSGRAAPYQQLKPFMLFRRHYSRDDKLPQAKATQALLLMPMHSH